MCIRDSWKILKQSEGQLLATNAYALLTSDYFSFAKTQCAVSYTHLDVYKRQDDGRDIASDITTEIFFKELFSDLTEKEKKIVSDYFRCV